MLIAILVAVLAASAPQDGKQPVPAADAREQAAKYIRRTYSEEFADTSWGGKQRLAETLLTAAEALDDDPVGRYELLDEARQLATDAHAIGPAVRAVEQLEARYAINGKALRVEAIRAVASNCPADGMAELASAAMLLLEQCLAANDLENAKSLLAIAKVPVERTDDAELKARWQAAAKKLEQFKKIEPAMERWKADPKDPEANLQLGLHACFVLGDLEKGLPMLARGSDSAIKAAAELELAKPATSPAQLDLAEAWYDVGSASKADCRVAILAHAASWYRTAEPVLHGLAKQRAAERLKDIEALAGAAPDVAGAPPAESKPTAGPKYANRKKAGSGATIRNALDWLRRHQDAKGYWSCAGFAQQCNGARCDGGGVESEDVGVTGLALLALLGAGNTTRKGDYSDSVRRGVDYLMGIQDQETGSFGGPSGVLSMLYQQGIATLAMCEAYGLSEDPALKASAQRAVHFIQSARNPYKAWRYACPPNGDNDTSVTGWMILALKSASDFGLDVDSQAFEGGLLWIEEMTDPNTGRVGYIEKGGMPAREPGFEEKWPSQRVESMTAVGMFCRILLGADPAKSSELRSGADLLRKRLPQWDDTNGSIDFYYWYCGAYAMFQMGGSDWKSWEPRLREVIDKTQRSDGCEKGSWDPQFDPWGHRGGRVYSTALNCLTAEVFYRYAR